MSHIPPRSLITSEKFDRLFSEYKPTFTMIARSYVRADNVAEDLVIDSFIHFWENQHNLVVESSPQAYILGIVKKKCVMYLRDQRIHERARQNIYKFSCWEIEQGIAVLEDCQLTKQLFSNEVQAIFDSNIQSLPEITRKIFQASRNENLTYIEIAAKYSLSVRQVDREMQRALSSLRVALKDYLPVLILNLLLLKNQ